MYVDRIQTESTSSCALVVVNLRMLNPESPSEAELAKNAK
jgi:hypothetical protein